MIYSRVTRFENKDKNKKYLYFFISLYINKKFISNLLLISNFHNARAAAFSKTELFKFHFFFSTALSSWALLGNILDISS